MYTQMTTNLMVENVDTAVAFYKNILDFSVIVSVPGENDALKFAILSKDGLMLMLQEKNSFIEEYPVLAIENVKPSVSLYIAIDNFAAFYADIKSKHAIYTDIHTTFYGSKEFAITDIDGYVLTFTEHKPQS